MTNFRDRKWPIPANPSPLETLCYQIDLPNDPQFIAAFIGAVFELSYWFNFDTDPLKQGRLVAATWLKALNTLRLCQSSTPVGGGSGADTELMIRQNPTNPCLLESSLDGATWCAFADLSKCFTSASQPGAGSPQPVPGGGIQQYCQTLQANGQLLLPTLVNSGDTLTLVSASGAGNDGGGSRWNCPDGSLFFAGGCQGGKEIGGGDPMPAVAHMALIYSIAGTFYDATAGVVTVPGGVNNAQVLVQVNDTAIANNVGSYDVCIDVKNNAAATWVAELDYTRSDYGAIIGSDVHDHYGQWMPGVGFQSTLYSFVPQGVLNFFFTFAPTTTILSVETYFSRTSPTIPAGLPNHEYGQVAGTITWDHTLPVGPGTLDDLAVGSGAIDALGFFTGIDSTNATGVTVTKQVIRGTGVNPFLGR